MMDVLADLDTVAYVRCVSLRNFRKRKILRRSWAPLEAKRSLNRLY